LNTGILIDHN